MAYYYDFRLGNTEYRLRRDSLGTFYLEMPYGSVRNIICLEAQNVHDALTEMWTWCKIPSCFSGDIEHAKMLLNTEIETDFAMYDFLRDDD